MANWETLKSWLGGWFGVFVYAAILCLFIVGLLKCILPVARTRELLKRAVKYIKQGEKAKRSWQDEKFLGKGALMPHWTEYLNNLFFADGEYHNPSNVEDYINEETVIEGPGRVNLAEAIPGVLVSLGFLGTLMGLSVALANLNTADAANALSASMKTLLDSMKYAFLTSIFGVIGSILFTLLTRVVNGRAQRALSLFYNAMSRFAGVLSVDPMTQIAIYQQEQTVLLKQLAEAVGEKSLKTSFRNAVIEAMAPFRASLDNFIDMTGEKQARLMNGVAETYLRKMDEMLGGELDMLSKTIQDTCRYQEKTVRSVNDSLTDFTEAARAMLNVRQQIEALFDGCRQTLSYMHDAQARLESASHAQNDVLDELAGVSEQFGKQATALMQATDAFLTRTDELSATNADALNIAAEALTRSGDALTKTLADARARLTRDMDESLDYFESCMTEILKRVEWAADAARGAAEGGAPNRHLKDVSAPVRPKRAAAARK